ncbi:tRNA (guanine(37)-N(1))-methyltransferase isoform X1 [Leptinotarsa decemlineata]|uniref:tRNA (guanine(37)-N(1))-methyltransferase isoform X1 n=1 Tax=Leptinotarsa decemlineata TaxID=7539 RepID=UPI003D30CE7C
MKCSEKLFSTYLRYFKIFSKGNRYISTANIFFSKMRPPSSVSGLMHLDKKLFEMESQISYLSIKLSQLQTILPIMKKYLLKLEKLKPVQHMSSDEIEIYLNPNVVSDWTSFPTEVQNLLEKMAITENNLLRKNLTVKYENYTAEELLKAILPSEREGMSSFTKIGHIVHVNLREHLLPYKEIIGEILYDKIPGCKSVVNKVNMIDNTYRYFSMELLKGDNDMMTTVKENNCTFKFDFSKVYWNSRLCTEHERIVKLLKENDVLFDVFAGVGPFSIPAAKKKCFVYANDLNPDSFNWLKHNAKSNKVGENYFKSFNIDGRDFIKNNIRQNLPQHLIKKQKVFITMNLPAMAVEFLDSFVGLFNEDELPFISDPITIFVYCFAKGENHIDIAKNLVMDNFGHDVSDKISDIFRVRTVSSMKEMMRVTVKLDRDILVGMCKKRKFEDSFHSQNKKSSISDGKKPQKS